MRGQAWSEQLCILLGPVNQLVQSHYAFCYYNRFMKRIALQFSWGHIDTQFLSTWLHKKGTYIPRTRKILTFMSASWACSVALQVQSSWHETRKHHFQHHITYRLGRILGQKLAFCLIWICPDQVLRVIVLSWVCLNTFRRLCVKLYKSFNEHSSHSSSGKIILFLPK